MTPDSSAGGADPTSSLAEMVAAGAEDVSAASQLLKPERGPDGELYSAHAQAYELANRAVVQLDLCVREASGLVARLDAVEAERDAARAEVEALSDFKDLLAFVDDAGQPVMKSWEQAHRHHKDEPYIGCVFCRDQFVKQARAESAERQLAECQKALRFYGDEDNWKWDFADPPWPHPPLMDDLGSRARAVLAQLQERGGDRG